MSVLFRQAQRTIIRLILILCVALFMFVILAQEARSQTLSNEFATIRSEEQVITSQRDRTFRYRLDYFLNQHGEREVQIALVEAHWLAKDTRLVVLRGRDSNSDGLIDSWFYADGAIIKSLRRSADSENAWPVARQILMDLSLNESRWISSLAAKELLAGLFFTIEGEIEDTKELEQTQINLIDLDYKIQDLELSNENPALVHELQRVSSEGWKQLLDRWNRTRINDRHMRIMGDISLFVGFAAALKGVKFLLAKTLSSESLSSLKTYMRGSIEEQKVWTQKLSNKVANVSSKAKKLGKGTTPLSLESAKAASTIRFGSETEALSWFSRNKMFSNSLKQIGGFFKSAATASWDKRGYIVMAQTIQLAIESYNRGYWKFSEAPLVLDHPVQSTQQFINQVGHDKGLLQNLSYMTLQTTLLSGVSESLERRGAALGVKYAVCSIITLIDSSTVNVLVQGKSDYPRIAFDTAWELLVGGSQIHLDLFMLRWANGLAEKFKNPKLKLVGYLLGSIDQTIGYFTYNRVTSKYFEPDKALSALEGEAIPPVIIVPVLAPQL